MTSERSFTREKFETLKVQLEKERRVMIKLVSGSMSPVMRTGTVAVVEFCRFEDLKPLDFVVFYSDPILICHALWGFGQLPAPNGDRTLITRGLTSPFADDPVRESLILGRVISHRISRFGFFLTSVRAMVLQKLGWRPKPEIEL